MRKSREMALGGVLAALAIVIMTLGGLIPFATYVCPMLCGILLMFVCTMCGNRVGWAWYGAVSLLSILLGPDKEAAAVFVGLGYYPIIKPYLDKTRLRWFWKLLLFNAVTAILYALLMYVFGMEQLMTEFKEVGRIGLLITLFLGNVCFIMLDRALTMFQSKTKRNKR